MSDNKKTWDNSWEAVWQREVDELTEQLKNPARYSASEVAFKQSRKKQLEEAIAKRKQKKDLTAGFAKGKQNIQDKAAVNQAQMSRVMAGQGME